MRAAIAQGLGEALSRRLQSAVLLVVLALTSGATGLAVILLFESNAPYDRAFETYRGAHVIAFANVSGELATTRRLDGVAATAGPFASITGPVSHGTAKLFLRLTGRTDRGGAAMSIGSSW